MRRLEERILPAYVKAMKKIAKMPELRSVKVRAGRQKISSGSIEVYVQVTFTPVTSNGD